MVYLILLYIFPVISESVIPNSLGSYIRIHYINIQFCVISVSVISDSVILVSIISDSYLVISDSLYLIPLYQNPLYQIHCGHPDKCENGMAISGLQMKLFRFEVGHLSISPERFPIPSYDTTRILCLLQLLLFHTS